MKPTRIRLMALLFCSIGTTLLFLNSLGKFYPLQTAVDKQWGHLLSLEEEYGAKKLLLVIVYTSRSQMRDTVETISETWGKSASWFVVVGGRETVNDNDSNGRVLHTWQCEDFSPDFITSNQLFCLLRVVRDEFLRSSKWFTFVSLRTYVAVKDIERVLMRLDSHLPAYLGHPVTTHLDTTSPPYCHGGPGITLSSAALDSITAQLSKNCIGSGLPGDVELGRCFNQQLNVYCSSSAEALRFFVNVVHATSVSLDRMWYSTAFKDMLTQRTSFRDMLTLHPVQTRAHMKLVHLFVKDREAQSLKKQSQVLTNIVEGMCSSILQDSVEPAVTANICNTTAGAHHTSRGRASQLFQKPFALQSSSEVTPWVSFSDKTVYTGTSVQPATRITCEMEVELAYVAEKAVQHINMFQEEEVKLRSIQSGYVRYRGSQGREYILDLQLANRYGNSKQHVEILRPHEPVLMFKEVPVLSRPEVVNFVVPLTHVTERFAEFLKMYEHICLATAESCRLVLSVLGKKDLSHIKQSIAELEAKYPKGLFKIVVSSSSKLFSRARALHFGLSALNGSDLAFLCDADMRITNKHFLDNCRQNAIQGKRVYYPEVFLYYDMSYAYRFDRKPAQFAITRRHGHWGTYGYGMVVLYKSDYDQTTGFDISNEGWGGEDEDLFQKLVKANLEVLKAPEPLLYHRYHERVCDHNLGAAKMAACQSSRSELLADRMQLADYVRYLEQKCGVTKS